jgi:predicted  nucleic acid-binding Zn-ribbon protein
MSGSIKIPQRFRVGLSDSSASDKSSTTTGTEAPSHKSRLSGMGGLGKLMRGRSPSSSQSSIPSSSSSSSSSAPRQDASVLSKMLGGLRHTKNDQLNAENLARLNASHGHSTTHAAAGETMSEIGSAVTSEGKEPKQTQADKDIAMLVKHFGGEDVLRPEFTEKEIRETLAKPGDEMKTYLEDTIVTLHQKQADAAEYMKDMPSEKDLATLSKQLGRDGAAFVREVFTDPSDSLNHEMKAIFLKELGQRHELAKNMPSEKEMSAIAKASKMDVSDIREAFTETDETSEVLREAFSKDLQQLREGKQLQSFRRSPKELMGDVRHGIGQHVNQFRQAKLDKGLAKAEKDLNATKADLAKVMNEARGQIAHTESVQEILSNTSFGSEVSETEMNEMIAEAEQEQIRSVGSTPDLVPKKVELEQHATPQPDVMQPGVKAAPERTPPRTAVGA